MVTFAPWCSAGVVWMLRPPTWKNGYVCSAAGGGAGSAAAGGSSESDDDFGEEPF
jgi:hypothetical protein